MTAQTEQFVSVLRNGQTPSWMVAQERDYDWLTLAISSVSRNGHTFEQWNLIDEIARSEWAQKLAKTIEGKRCQGIVTFCDSPNLICCIANKSPNVRAIVVRTIFDAAEGIVEMNANLLAVEMPGRTYFEICQILQMASESTPPGRRITTNDERRTTNDP